MRLKLTPPIRYSQDEVNWQVEQASKAAVDRALHRDRVAGFLAGVATLQVPPAGVTSTVNIGYHTLLAVAAELKARGFN